MHRPASMDFRLALLLALTLLGVIGVLFVPPLPQDPDYHRFADTRGWLGIPNFWDVVSNLPFLLIGLAGWRQLQTGHLPACLPECRNAWRVFFIGIALIGCGSAYYHWNPTNASLVWDRVPMAVSFMAFFAAIVSENISAAAGRRLLMPLVLIGVLSVVYWGWSETVGRGDLRFYALVQFLPMLLLPLILLLYRSPFSSNAWLWWAMLAYGLAKVLEYFDEPLFTLLGISGHTLKHLVAAVGAGFIWLALRSRLVAQDSPPG